MKRDGTKKMAKRAATIALIGLLTGSVYAGAADAYSLTIGTISEEYTWGNYYQKLIETSYAYIQQTSCTATMGGTYYRIVRVGGAEATNSTNFIAYNDMSSHQIPYTSNYVSIINTNMALKARAASSYTGYTVTGAWNPNG